MTGFSKHSNEPSGPIKCRKCFH